jgi:DNA-binding CsgD family transcriptional regulator
MPLDVSHFVLDLYALAPGTPSPGYCEAVLELLRRTVPFDSGLWATFTRTAGGPRPHWSHLHRIPPQMVAEYERVKQHDVVNQKLIANPGRSFAVELRKAERDAHPDMVAHARRWRMEQTLATVLLESPLNLYTVICLYRADPSRPYTERERRFKQAIMPHLVAAWHRNVLQFLDAPAEERHRPPRARALIDRFGVIHNAEPGLAELFRLEQPGWEGPAIPSSLRAIAEGDRRDLPGKAVVITRLRTLEDGTLVVALRRRGRVDSLTPRELAVAREFAAGKTHRNIAGSLGTSPATVRSQLQAVYTKLGVGTKIDLARRLDDAS